MRHHARVQASPHRPLAVLLVLVGVAAFAVLPLVDATGRVLLVPTAVLAAVLGVRDLLLRPVLSAGPAGLSVVDGWVRVQAAWPQLVAARVVVDRRSPALELDLGDRLVLLSRRRLGAEPYAVLAGLEAERPAGPGDDGAALPTRR